MTFAQVAESVCRLAQLEALIDHGLDLPGSRAAPPGAEILPLDLRDEELDCLAPAQRRQPRSDQVRQGSEPPFDGNFAPTTTIVASGVSTRLNSRNGRLPAMSSISSWRSLRCVKSSWL